MNSKLRTIRGFTLIEILVVIAIIGVLIAVAMASFSQARSNSRDKTRMADIEQVKAAMQLYAAANGTFHIAGAGSGGQGWFAYENGGTYPQSLAEELVVLGILSNVIHDPLVPAGSASAGTHRQYMNYFHSDGARAGTCLFAQLENPTAEHVAAMDAAPISSSLRNTLRTSYFMNYATCTP